MGYRGEAPVTKKKILKYIPPILGVVVLLGVVVGLHGALRHIHVSDVLGALAATPRHEVVHALLLLAVSFCIMPIYDIPGILFARRLVAFPRLKFRQVALASFSAYALSHVLGAPALSGAAIRFRLYAQWDVPALGIARIVALSGSAFSFGLATCLSFLLLVHPGDLPLFGHGVPYWALRLVGLGLAAVVVFYVTLRQPELRIFRRVIELPGPWLALAQVAVSCLDITVACGVLYVVLPDAPGLSYAHVLGVYLAAFAGGLFSGLPGGVGVFDSLLLLGLAGFLSPATALGAILLFRVLYYLVPAVAAALFYAGHEVWIRVK